ncbi:MAG: DNA-3-methyladenine glycosylase I [Alphaproteobacteria bacterium]|jgi:DNA-3-methyladenine glycosylase I|nr:DNA-3-methyladenine glycosylase I [Alphaproteobacteria bacterium]MBT5389426.1 DNA-3-methyladenine glycosylase I [Alphaproteobacteria bacterium]MBT5540514.1 DNA-3-methyladenine glycosylase I [Alphaproteobacteria bacterium]
MSSYCQIAQNDPLHGPYHDKEYGFPITDDSVLFERLCLEIFQAGLSWSTILKKRQNFFEAFQGFDPGVVAKFGGGDMDRLMQDAGIIRNRLKIEATIKNARTILDLAKTHGSFSNWLLTNHPLSKDEWVKLFKKTFFFTGPEIVGEFLMSLGYLPGAHASNCPVYKEIIVLMPPWKRASKTA